MVDHLIGIILLGLGITSPMNPNVKGVSTHIEQAANDTSASGSSQHGVRTAEAEVVHTSAINIHSLSGEVRETTQGIRRDLHLEVETKRQEASESMRKRLGVFQNKLKVLKDERKKNTLENIQQRITQLNTDRTDRMTGQLNTMSDLLVRIVTMGEELKKNGKNISTLDTAVASAQAAIKTASDAVVLQAVKPYVVTITTESELRNDVGVVRTILETDLKSVSFDVTAARKSVSNVIGVLARLRGEPVPESVIK